MIGDLSDGTVNVHAGTLALPRLVGTVSVLALAPVTTSAGGQGVFGR